MHQSRGLKLIIVGNSSMSNCFVGSPISADPQAHKTAKHERDSSSLEICGVKHESWLI